METQSNIQILDGFIAAGSEVQLAAGLSQVPSKNTIANFRQQILRKDDLDRDDLQDLIKRSLGPNKDFVRFLDIINVCTILLKPSQLDVLQLWVRKNVFRRVYLDATGSILRKVSHTSPELLHHVLLISIHVADDPRMMPFNVAEMITSSQSMLTIKHFLEIVKKLANDHKPSTTQLFHEVVTDKSFANIGAILLAFNNLKLSEYLEKCWAILNIPDQRQQKEAIKGLTVVRLCSSHTCKTMRDLVNASFGDRNAKFTVCGMIAHMFNITQVEQLLKYCENFLFCLLSEFVGPNMRAAGVNNKTILARTLGCGQVIDLIKMEDEEEMAGSLNVDTPENITSHNAIYKSSRVYQRLKQFTEECEFDTAGEPNKFYNEKFADNFLKCHLSYILLWGNVMTAIRDDKVARANNGIIENSFAMKKREVRESKHKIGSFGKIKIGRFVKHSSEIIDLRVKKVMLNIPAKSYGSKPKVPSDQHSHTDLDVANSTEMYRKRNPRERRQRPFFRSTPSLLSRQLPTSRRSSSLSNKSDNSSVSDSD